MSQHHTPSKPFEYRGDPMSLARESGVDPRAEAILVRTGQARVLVNENGNPYTDPNGNHLMVDKKGEYLVTGARVMRMQGHDTVIMEIPSRLLPSEHTAQVAQEIFNHFNRQQQPRGR